MYLIFESFISIYANILFPRIICYKIDKIPFRNCYLNFVCSFILEIINCLTVYGEIEIKFNILHILDIPIWLYFETLDDSVKIKFKIFLTPHGLKCDTSLITARLRVLHFKCPLCTLCLRDVWVDQWLILIGEEGKPCPVIGQYQLIVTCGYFIVQWLKTWWNLPEGCYCNASVNIADYF